MTTLYIIRHGQTKENTQKILQGHIPGTLTEEGKLQIKATAIQLANERIMTKCIVSSDLKRAVDSAKIIAEELHLPVFTTEILRERDWKEYTGMPVEEAASKFRNNGKWCFPEGTVESEEEIHKRAQLALETLKEEYNGESIIVLTHGLFARYMIAAHLNCPVQIVPSFSNAEVRKIEV